MDLREFEFKVELLVNVDVVLDVKKFLKFNRVKWINMFLMLFCFYFVFMFMEFVII